MRVLNTSVNSEGPAVAAYEFNETDLRDIRRYCGYQALTNNPGHVLANIILNGPGILEHRITSLTETEGEWVTAQLVILRKLEADLVDANDNLDTNKIAVIDRNPTELIEREAFISRQRHKLCNFLGVQPGPDLLQAAPVRRFWV